MKGQTLIALCMTAVAIVGFICAKDIVVENKRLEVIKETRDLIEREAELHPSRPQSQIELYTNKQEAKL